MRLPRFRSRVWMTVLAAAALFGVWLSYRAYASPPRGPMGEVVSPDESAYESQIIDSGIKMLLVTREQKGDGLYRRDAHAKTHGCVLANFKVGKNGGTPFEQGLFAKEHSYKAWIRFSSGSTALQSDWAPDARGMAIKVLGVPGLKLLEGEEQARTQDFVMINNPVFFIRDVEEYASLTRYQGQGSQFGYFFQSSNNPAKWKLREFRIGLGLLGHWPPQNLLGTQFHSMTAYKLGAANHVKYSAKPAPCDSKSSVPDEFALGSNALREHLEERIKTAPACFDFVAQLQVPDKDMPIEDSTVLWREKDSPFVTVARIEVPADKDVAKNMENNFCENLSFTPWHSLPDHQPVGGLNRIRKSVYQGISRYRRCLNHIGFGEPKENGSREFELGPDACDPRKPVPVIPSAESQ
jgi:hypothetical protein